MVGTRWDVVFVIVLVLISVMVMVSVLVVDLIVVMMVIPRAQDSWARRPERRTGVGGEVEAGQVEASAWLVSWPANLLTS